MTSISPRKACVASLISLLVTSHAYAQAAATSASTFVVGAGIGGAAEYTGADSMRIFPVITADYQSSNGFFASVARGIGYVAKIDRFTVSGAVGYDGGRSDKKKRFSSGSDDLKGMGKIKGAALAKLRAGYDFGPLAMFLDADIALNDDDRGNSYQLTASAPLFADRVNQFTAIVSSKYRDDKNMQTYFGVTARQSSNSGYRSFQAKAGVENISLSLNWNHVINNAWSLNTTAGAARLMNDAADSPLTKRKTGPLLIGVANYRF